MQKLHEYDSWSFVQAQVATELVPGVIRQHLEPPWYN
jgi:hypothetical protein